MMKIIGALMVMIAEAFQKVKDMDELLETVSKYKDRGRDLMEGHTGDYVPVDIFSHSEKVLQMYEKIEINEEHAKKILKENNLPENFLNEALANHYRLVRKYPKPKVKRLHPFEGVDTSLPKVQKALKEADKAIKKVIKKND